MIIASKRFPINIYGQLICINSIDQFLHLFDDLLFLKIFEYIVYVNKVIYTLIYILQKTMSNFQKIFLEVDIKYAAFVRYALNYFVTSVYNQH